MASTMRLRQFQQLCAELLGPGGEPAAAALAALDAPIRGGDDDAHLVFSERDGDLALIRRFAAASGRLDARIDAVLSEVASQRHARRTASDCPPGPPRPRNSLSER